MLNASQRISNLNQQSIQKNNNPFLKRNVLNFGTGLTSQEIRSKLANGETVPYKTLQNNYNELTDVFEKKMTPVDTLDIIDQRKTAAKSFCDSKRPSIFDSNDRKDFRRNLIDRLYSINLINRKHEAKAEVVFGLPASGKTSQVAEPLAEKNGALLIDGDITRELEPQYKENAANKFYKEEQKEIEKRVKDKAIENHDNIVYNIVYRDETTATMKKTLKELRDHDYKVNLNFVDIPTRTAADRAVKRSEITSRFMDPLEIYCLDKTPRKIYEELKQEKCFDAYRLYDNNVPIEEPATLIENISFLGKKELSGTTKQPQLLRKAT